MSRRSFSCARGPQRLLATLRFLETAHCRAAKLDARVTHECVESDGAAVPEVVEPGRRDGRDGRRREGRCGARLGARLRWQQSATAVIAADVTRDRLAAVADRDAVAVETQLHALMHERLGRARRSR
jgi:hypothetical protein